MVGATALSVAFAPAARPASPSAATAAGRNVSPPTLIGNAPIRETLTTSMRTWTGADPLTHAHQWQRCHSSGTCRSISVATAPAYKLSMGHEGRIAVVSGQTSTDLMGAVTCGSTAISVAPPTAIGQDPAAPQFIVWRTLFYRYDGAAWQPVSAAPFLVGYAAPGALASEWWVVDTGAPAGSTSTVRQSYTVSPQIGVWVAVQEVHRFSSTLQYAGGSALLPSLAEGPNAVGPVCNWPPASGLHVVGNQLLDAEGKVVRLHGVNFSGPEYACVQGWGIFDGPSDAASVAAMASWNINVVRIPINETCWLNINGVSPAYAGANYQKAIVDYVNLLHQHGMYAELSLMWAAPGTYRATYQPGAPNADHSPALWASLAAAFKDDPNVILAPWGETIVNADCFLNGGVCEATYGPNNTPYATAGMQQAVNVIRQAGYRGVIAIPGIDYANNLTHWLSHQPSDPLGQLVAEAHLYGKNTCSSTVCLDTTYAPVAAKVPLVFGETGETYDASSCGSTNISRFMNWADAHAAGYMAWTWNTWGNCSALISDFTGTPYSPYGTWVKAHYLTLP
jgi:hypothetical protein